MVRQDLLSFRAESSQGAEVSSQEEIAMKIQEARKQEWWCKATFNEEDGLGNDSEEGNDFNVDNDEFLKFFF